MLFTTPFFKDEVQNLKAGDFVHYRNSPYEGVGVVSKINKNGVELALFDSGFTDIIYAQAGYVCLASEQEFMDHLDSIDRKFEETTAQGGLKGAVSARRQHGLQSVKEYVEWRSARMLEFVKFPEPKTGIYVLMGIYSGQGESDQLQGIEAIPRVSESPLGQILFDIFPTGIGGILNDIYNTPSTSRGSLVAYRAFEVPRRALDFVKNPLSLEIRLR